MAHGLTESIGLTHYRYDPTKSDETLFEQGYNRIYDTLEMEANLNDVERLVAPTLDDVDAGGRRVVLGAAAAARSAASWTRWDMGRAFCAAPSSRTCPCSSRRSPTARWASTSRRGPCGDWVGKRTELDPRTLSSDELLQVAAAVQPVPGPAGVRAAGRHARRRWASSRSAAACRATGRSRSRRSTTSPSTGSGSDLRAAAVQYGVRICPEPVHWGGCRGCTYSEGVSWGKFVPPREGGRFAEVYADATVVWPLLMKAVFEELDGE